MSALLSAAGEQHVHTPTATETGIHSHLEQLRRAKKKQKKNMEGQVRRVRVNLWIRVTPHLHGAVSTETDALHEMISRITLNPPLLPRSDQSQAAPEPSCSHVITKMNNLLSCLSVVMLAVSTSVSPQYSYCQKYNSIERNLFQTTM